jgi:hypothetical protein
VQVHEQASGNRRIPGHIRHQPIRKTKGGRWLVALSRADNLRDPSEELFCRYRRILRRQCVTLGNEAPLFAISGRTNHAMSEELPFASVQNDITRKNFTEIASLDKEDIARPYGRQHAMPCDLQTQTAEATQDLCGKFAFQPVLSALRTVVQLPHETFLLCMHPLCVAWTLPHLSAEVSNTCS